MAVAQTVLGECGECLEGASQRMWEEYCACFKSAHEKGSGWRGALSGRESDEDNVGLQTRGRGIANHIWQEDGRRSTAPEGVVWEEAV